MKVYAVTILLSSLLANSFANRLGSGPSATVISSTAPNLPGGTVAVDAPPGPFFQGFKPPFPTNSWWAGFTVGNQDSIAAGPFPFQTKTGNQGLQFGVSTKRSFDGTSIHQDTSLDIQAGFTGLPVAINNRKAVSWDTQTVTLRYSGAGATMDAILVPGSPYMTLTFNNAQVVLTTLGGNVDSFTWVTPGSKGTISAAKGTVIYTLYVVSGSLSGFTTNQNQLTSTSAFTGTIRLAKVLDPSQQSILDASASTYPTGVTVAFTVAADVSTQTWTWDVVGNAGNLLLLSWPHHRKSLVSPSYANIQYMTLKGYMKGVLGNSWVLKHNLPAVTWFAANPPQASCLAEIQKNLVAEVKALTPSTPGDFYFWGGGAGRIAQLATIAEHVGRTDLIPQIISVLKTSIGYWFDPTHQPAATYETGWGGLINGAGWNSSWVDFGNAYYNDHHFHYGYFMHAAAVIGKYDSAWLAQHLDFLNHMARDYGNPSPNDASYPVARMFDFFAGHSWASGIGNGAGPRDQESTSEAINGYYGLFLFATVSNNQPLVNFARLLLAQEIQGAQTYWHLYPTVNDPDTPYPEQAFRNLVSVGNVMDTQSGAWLFWGTPGQIPHQVAAIQILPVTPVGTYTYDPAWMQQVVAYTADNLNDNTIADDFKSVILAAYSKVNPQDAYTRSLQLSSWGTGNSATNQLYFISTQPSASNICSGGLQTPEGLYLIQDVATGNYVSAGASALSATSPSTVLATQFQLTFVPGGNTIQSVSSQNYVSAGPEGTAPVNANAAKASSYEIFRFTSVGNNQYQWKAMVNKQNINTAANGNLINNGVASTYRLVPATTIQVPTVPASGYLQNVQTKNFVVSTKTAPKLLATSAAVTGATKFRFTKVAGSTSPLYTIWNDATNQAVTATPDGATPLSAARATAGAWEQFQVAQDQGALVFISVASGLAVNVQGDNSLLSNDKAIGSGAHWTIVAA